MFTFKLSDSFVDQYQDRPVKFGFPDASEFNSIGHITFLRSYSRKKEDGTKENWAETCRRITEGSFTLQKNYIQTHILDWNYGKAQRAAQDSYDRMFQMKWTPPGRGLAMMGSAQVMELNEGSSLNNCGVISTAEMTREDPAGPFLWLMTASTLGIGVGFDQLGAKKKLKIYAPDRTNLYSKINLFVIPDTREGWVEAYKHCLESYLKPNKQFVEFDYSLIRPAGAPIKTFGGVASGPAPLKLLLESVRSLLDGREGETIGTTDIADLGNMIGVCIQQGGVRRSAQMLMGDLEDPDFLGLKDYNSATGQRRLGWSHLSNNSINAHVGQDLSSIVPGIVANGEPGVLWMDTVRKFGRLKDPADFKDIRVASLNPCAEQPLESGELCTLTDIYLENHDSLEDFKKTIKVAYLYAKTVTLVPTRWPKTNAIMQRNRRIGLSLSGVANFVDHKGLPELRRWLDAGYEEVRRLDKIYSEWLCVRESIRVTTIKPGGTTGTLTGNSPGAHWNPGGSFYMRTIRFGATDPMLPLFRAANYRIEDDVTDKSGATKVVYFPIHSKAKRSERDVSIFEKANLAATLQELWSDNAVSVTLSFDPETEGKHIGSILTMFEGKLKTVSFLPMLEEGAYPQMPYGNLTEEEYNEYTLQLMPIDFADIYAGLGQEAIEEKFCTTDSCEIKNFTSNAEESK